MYNFLKKIGKIINSRQSNTVLLTGNIYDLFYLDPIRETGDEYVPLLNYITGTWGWSGKTIVHYDLNSSITFASNNHKEQFRLYWIMWKTLLTRDEVLIKLKTGDKNVKDADKFFYELNDTIGKPTAAFELLRQMSMCVNDSFIQKNCQSELIIIIENSDMIMPEGGDLSRISDVDRRRIGVCHDWFTDPSFMDGHSSVILTSESRSLLNKRISTLPQIIEAEIPSPSDEERLKFIEWFSKKYQENTKLNINGSGEKIARLTAGLSIHALRQVFIEAVYDDSEISMDSIIHKVEDFIKGQLGEDVIEFKKPSHNLNNVVGFSDLKKFLREEFIPRIQSSDDDCLSGAAVSGPIGVGKSFIFEAVASELDMPVLILKNIRSQWFGQTDVIFERLKRVLEALNKALIFVDEADTQFGGVGDDAHETEKRLTGKIQAMMSDPKLKGKIVWLLMTARIHKLSPDIRRPGRAGDLIIPVLDPENGSEDHLSFIKWMVGNYMEDGTGLTLDYYFVDDTKNINLLQALTMATKTFSAASFASLRNEIKSKKNKTIPILEIIDDHIPANIEKTRQYQTYQALMNCTRKSLLPVKYRKDLEKHREEWLAGIRCIELELGKEKC